MILSLLLLSLVAGQLVVAAPAEAQTIADKTKHVVFKYTDGHKDDFLWTGGNDVNKNDVSPPLHVNKLHVSCSDTINPDGTATKSDLAGHLVADGGKAWYIEEYKAKENAWVLKCGIKFPDEPEDQPCPAGSTFLVKFDGANLTPVGGDAKGITVTKEVTSGSETKQIGWTSSTHPIKAVLVKGGTGSNVYNYSNAFSGTGLTAPENKAISNVIFCSGPPTEKPDLEIIKTDSPDPVVKGGTVTYNIAVRNLGPATATNVIVSDTLQAGVIYQSATTTQGSCNKSGSLLTCNLGTLTAGQTVTITMKATLDACGNLQNTATVKADQAETNMSNNSSTATTTVNCNETDIEIIKLDSPDPVAKGGTLTYSITVKNIGPTTATGVTVSDTLLAGVIYQSITSSQGSCSKNGADLTCNLGTLTPGQSATITLKVIVDCCGIVANTATVKADQAETNMSNNSSTTHTTVLCDENVDLKVVKTSSSASVPKNGQFTYSITVTNLGPGAATGVVVTDQLQPTVWFDSSTDCTKNGSTLTCNIGSLAPGASKTVTFKAHINACGQASNTATVKGNQTDPNQANNSSTVHVTATCDTTPDLQIIKTDSPDPVASGGAVTYTITVKNLGPGDATGVVVTDNLPAGVFYVSHNTSQGSCVKNGALITCNLGNLASGATATITLNVTITACGSVHNEASVDSDQTDPNMANNTAWADTTVTCDEEDVDLEITKVDNMDPIPAGGHLIYTVTVKNLGLATAHNVVVTDTITHVNWRLWSPPSPSQGTCSPTDADTGDVITCNLGTLGPGATATITLDVKPRICDNMTNTAIVSATETETNNTNNSATEHTAIQGDCDIDPDMSIMASGNKKVRIGKLATYEFDIYQGGPEHGTGITVTATLDDELDLLSAISSQGACSLDGNKLTCELGEMSVYTNASVTVVAKGLRAGKAVNKAEVDVNEYDADLTNNVTTFKTKIRAPKVGHKGKHRLVF